MTLSPSRLSSPKQRWSFGPADRHQHLCSQVGGFPNSLGRPIAAGARWARPDPATHSDPGLLRLAPKWGTLVPIMGSALGALLPATRRTLLEGFFLRPDRRFFQRELIRLVGRGQGSVQRELARLVGAGIVLREDEHGRSYYRANPGSPIFPELRSLVEKTTGIGVVVRQALAPLDGVEVAFVFGSVARGDERAESDVDLAVVGEVTFRSVVGALAAAEKRIGREINPVVYSPGELRRRAADQDHFVSELLSSKKLFLIGAKDDLEAVVREPMAHSP